MAGVQISDEQIAGMSTPQRRELILRLSRTDGAGLPTPSQVRRMRRRRIVGVGGSVVVLVPWTVYLAATLPSRHIVRHWTLTWVGFDILLLLSFVLTAVFGAMRRQLVAYFAVVTGTLLVCDAWFDVVTAGPHDVRAALASALIAEVPLALLLITGAVRMMRMTAVRLCLIEPGQRIWAAPLPIADLFDRPGAARGL